LARTLITYQDQRDINTVRGIIDRWAPPNENNTHAYIEAVSQKIGAGPDDPIDVHQYTTMRPLVEAIIKHENGRCIYTRAQIDEGLRRAGVLPLPKLAVQKTMFSAEGVGTGTAGIGTAGMMLTEQAQQLQLTASDGSYIIQALCALLTLAGVLLTVYGLVKRVRSRSA
jgi:hypothetical protein